jgi:3-methyl-2-oxobutanoate hydroxymethyltransferase
MTRKTTEDIRTMKGRGAKIVMLTAYDYPSARLAEAADVDMLLVGDTLGMVVLGYDSTLPVTMEDMLHHTKAVVRGSERALVVADMPFMSYQTGIDDAMRNAGRFLQEACAQAVKLEGGVHMAETVRRLVQVGIPVVGHIGLTPQSVNQVGGYKVQGKTPAAAERLIEDAVALQQAGAFAVVLETIPAPLGKAISERLRVPTIGIGAGAGCDGQVQVWHDLLALYTAFVPKHAKQYAQVGEMIERAIGEYVAEVRSGAFPTEKESFGLSAEAAKALEGARG